MTRSLRSHVRLVACLLAFVAAAGAVCLAASRVRPLTIRLYDLAQHTESDRDVILETAESILGEAGVDAEWVSCSPRPSIVDPRCSAPRRDNDLIVRIVRDGELTGGEGRFPLGYAVVDADRGAGALATIFTERVQRAAAQARANVDVLLGRAVAHELGHLLLRSHAHSDHGLMREVWTDGELFRNRADDWVFSSRERAGLQQRVNAVAAVVVN